MATSAGLVSHLSRSRITPALFTLLGLGFLFVLWHDERYLIDHTLSYWSHYFPVRWALLPHGFAGLIVLLVGPFQFSSRSRRFGNLNLFVNIHDGLDVLLGDSKPTPARRRKKT